MEKFAGNGVEDDPEHGFSGLLQSNGDRESRQVVDVVRGPIQRIDNPAILRITACLGRRWERSVFFPQEIVVGKTPEENVPNRLLGGNVGFGDQIPQPFFTGSESVLPVEQELPSGPCRLFTNA